MTDLNELAARCEASTGPDRGIDNAVRLATNNGCAFGDDPAYTSSLDAAMTLVPEGFAYAVLGGPDCRATASLCRNDQIEADGEAATPALALTAACLKARAAMQEEVGRG